MSSDTEFTQFDELEKKTDKELEDVIIQGTNLHIHTSTASVAKRVLENRLQKKQLEAAKNVEVMAKQLESSHQKLVSIVGGLDEIVEILDFFKKRWLPKQSIWVRIGAFILGTVILGIVLNLIADWIVKFIFKW